MSRRSIELPITSSAVLQPLVRDVNTKWSDVSDPDNRAVCIDMNDRRATSTHVIHDFLGDWL